MASKRMFTSDIYMSDSFLDMPSDAKTLYFYILGQADDDGFNDQARSLMRLLQIPKDNLDILIAKGFIIAFDDGVVLVKHWLMHNTIRKDRYKQTNYLKYKKLVGIKNNNAYALLTTVSQPTGNQLATNWQPNGNQMATNWQPTGNPDKSSIDKSSIDKISIEESESINTYSLDSRSRVGEFEVYGQFKNVKLKTEQYESLKRDYPNHYEKYISDLSTYLEKDKRNYYSNHYAAILSWLSKDNIQAGSKIITPQLTVEFDDTDDPIWEEIRSL